MPSRTSPLQTLISSIHNAMQSSSVMVVDLRISCLTTSILMVLGLMVLLLHVSLGHIRVRQSILTQAMVQQRLTT